MDEARVAEVLGYIGANVRRLRLKHGMTQEKLAEVVGVELRTLQRIERGKTNLGTAVLVALADCLEVAPGALFRKAVTPAPARGRPKKGRGSSAT